LRINILVVSKIEVCYGEEGIREGDGLTNYSNTKAGVIDQNKFCMKWKKL
jgi:hypothetical protein